MRTGKSRGSHRTDGGKVQAHPGSEPVMANHVHVLQNGESVPPGYRGETVELANKYEKWNKN